MMVFYPMDPLSEHGVGGGGYFRDWGVGGGCAVSHLPFGEDSILVGGEPVASVMSATVLFVHPFDNET